MVGVETRQRGGVEGRGAAEEPAVRLAAERGFSTEGGDGHIDEWSADAPDGVAVRVALDHDSASLAGLGDQLDPGRLRWRRSGRAPGDELVQRGAQRLAVRAFVDA